MIVRRALPRRFRSKVIIWEVKILLKLERFFIH